jgi:hypothetical protein
MGHLRSKKLLSLHGKTYLENLVLFDEKLFSLEERVNPKNTHVYSVACLDIPQYFWKAKGFQGEGKVMFFWCRPQNWLFLVIFAEKGAKTKSIYYLEQVLRSFVKERRKRIHKNQI